MELDTRLTVCDAPTVTTFQGSKLKQARAAAGLTQKELGTIAGVQRETVNHAEMGRHLPGAETLGKIARALDLPVDTFFENGSA